MQKMAGDGAQSGCKTINPAANSMKLENILYAPLDNLDIEHLNEPVAEKIQRFMPTMSRKDRQNLNLGDLKEVDRMLKELAEIKKLAEKAKSYNKKYYTNSNTFNNTTDIKRMDRIEEILNSKHGITSEFIKRYGIQYFTEIVRANNKVKRNLKESEIAGNVYYQAYIKTICEIENILHFSRLRIASRLEEDQEQPDLDKLLDLWEQTNQQARALSWKSKHARLSESISEQQQQRFDLFDKKHQNTISDLERDLLSGTNIEASLNGTEGKALECLLNRDIDGLNLIKRALTTHHDKTQAKHFMEIVQAYLLELNGTTEEAIRFYESMTDGAHKFDVLKRLLCLYLEDKNNAASVRTLARLAVISPTFVPLLADMLCVVNEPEKAIELYTDYLLLTPSDLQSMFKLGKIYKQLGSNEGLEWAMNYILEKDPEFDDAKKLLAMTS
jgi:hypothetical protein